MNIALIGYGKMGHAIEAMAPERGHRVMARVDNASDWASEPWGTADVAVEFTTPQTAADNVRRLLEAGMPTVCGTTGWSDRLEEMRQLCRQRGGALFTASNFSIGMNIMYALNERLAELMKGRDAYTASITETHHVHKLDAPSGTALVLADQIRAGRGGEVSIESIRQGEVPGTHTVVYDSAIDTLTLTHEAHSRAGLAQGALMAAEWLAGRKGCFTMKDMLG